MKNRISTEEIETLRKKLNNYIRDNDFDSYNELLNMSRKLDKVINNWINNKKSK